MEHTKPVYVLTTNQELSNQIGSRIFSTIRQQLEDGLVVIPHGVTLTVVGDFNVTTIKGHE